MRIHYDPDRDLFYARCTFEQRLVFKRRGWTWRQDIKKWSTREEKKVLEFEDICEPSALDRLDQFEQERMDEVGASYAVDADLDIPTPEGLAPRGYQKAFVAYHLERPCVVLGDGPGLGKTIQAIVFSNYEQSIVRILVLCPASLKDNWKKEFEKWTTRGFKVCIPEIKTRTKTVKGKIVKKWKEMLWDVDANVYIINPEMLEQWHDHCREFEWDQLIVDECHEYKNPQAKRTQFIFGRRANKKKKQAAVKPLQARYKTFMTGTPLLSRPSELWVFCREFDKSDLGKDYLTFITRYCDAYKAPFGWVAQGRSNSDELAFKIRRFMIRRNKKEVLPDLPPKSRQIIELPREPFKKYLTIEENEVRTGLEAYERLLSGQEAEEVSEAVSPRDWTLEEIAGYIAERSGEFGAHVEKLDENASLVFEEFTLARRELALAKVDYTVEHIQSILDGGEKVIVFAVHAEVVEELWERFPQAAVIYGKTPNKKRQAQVDKFQNDPRCDVFIGNIKAAGVGHTLTAASMVVFLELPWTPGEIEQAEDRAWRIGQDNAVLIQYLLVQGSLDTHLIKTFIEKLETVKEVLDVDFRKR